MSSRQHSRYPDPQRGHRSRQDTQQYQPQQQTSKHPDYSRQQPYAPTQQYSAYYSDPAPAPAGGYPSQAADQTYAYPGYSPAAVDQDGRLYAPTSSTPWADQGSRADDQHEDDNRPPVVFPGHIDQQDDPRQRTADFVRTGRETRTGSRFPRRGRDARRTGRQNATHSISDFDRSFSSTQDNNVGAQDSQQAYPHAQQSDDPSYQVDPGYQYQGEVDPGYGNNPRYHDDTRYQVDPGYQANAQYQVNPQYQGDTRYPGHSSSHNYPN
ncbi:hypothetical protein NM208_g16469 [Fusarium decemcellulare]|uniref:Uncharacterized protein n=1 Tax=Fusarium decemcellulare TaxID=57161 RepID=A0ACC1RBG6_9HYPO|nr:hypothetical protein NM208_g16469 [Fusarium decemcellulare]